MNIRDFAKICGCSYGTVTNVFLRPEKVKESTRQKILALAEKHKYRPNLVAASIKGKTQMIGVLVYGGNSYFSQINLAIQKALMKNNYCPLSLVLDWRNRLQQLRYLIDRRVDGIIMVSPRKGLTKIEREEVDHIQIPVVYVELKQGTAFDYADTDDVAGGRMMAEYLFRKGHRHVVLYSNVTYPKNAYPIRFVSFIELAEELGIKWTQCTIDQLDGVISAPERPTAFFCYSDDHAVELMSWLKERGFVIPDDFSVAGYADLDFAKILTPGLTTVFQDGRVVGEKAAELLMKRLADPGMEHLHELVPVELIERESVADLQKKQEKDQINT